MKHRSLLLALALLSAQLIMAITYCASSPIGYGAAATGGGNATPTLVKSVSELTTALKASGNKVIIITQNITFTSMQKVKATNKTLMALPGVKLISLKQDATNSGILYFSSGSSNLILRNITFEGPGAYDCDGNDLLCFDGVTKAWVDHCDFQDGCDGNFDNKGNTDNVTVTWCRFRYLKAPKAGGPGGSDDHRYTNLLGSSSSDKPSDGTYNMTWAYCWWDNGCKERMLRCRNASLHFLNCYWNSNVANYYVGPENADCRFDGCSMQGNPAKAKYFYQNYGGKNGAIFTNCIAKNGVPSNVTNRTVATIPYTYTTETANDAVAAITSACGAGATLTVTTGGIVSSTCDGGTTPEPDPEPEPEPEPEPTEGTTWWNLSDSDFPTGTISSNTTVRHLTIVADGGTTWTVDGSQKSADGYSFTQRYKSGGAGSAAGRHFAFRVSGACTITVYALSSSSSAARVLNIVAGSAFSTTATGTINIPATSTLAGYTYNYTGGANNIYIASSASGINFYGIKVVGATVSDVVSSEIEEEDPTINDPENKSQTVVRGNAISDIIFTASGTATSITVSGLPAGLTSTKNGLTLTISGTPTAEGAYTITAKNASGGTSYEGGYITVEEPQTPEAGTTTDIVQQSVFWNMSDNDFKNLGTMKIETVVRQLHIVAADDEAIVVDANNKQIDGISFTNRLKFGGEGSATRQLWFDVKGNCTIDLYMMSSNSTNTRTLNICTGAYGQVVTTLPATTSISKQTYTYSGGATTIRLYPADGGINVYGIRLTYSPTTGMTSSVDSGRGVIRLVDGKIVVERNGKVYDLTGRLVH